MNILLAGGDSCGVLIFHHFILVRRCVECLADYRLPEEDFSKSQSHWSAGVNGEEHKDHQKSLHSSETSCLECKEELKKLTESFAAYDVPE